MEDGTFADPVESGTCNKIDEMTEIMACGPRAAENGILADPSDYQSWIVRSLRCIYYLLSKFFLEKKKTLFRSMSSILSNDSSAMEPIIVPGLSFALPKTTPRSMSDLMSNDSGAIELTIAPSYFFFFFELIYCPRGLSPIIDVAPSYAVLHSHLIDVLGQCQS